MEVSGCFCHPSPTTGPHHNTHISGVGGVGMDLDSALSELGMLSAVPDGHRQYLAERRRQEAGRRDRKTSEPTHTNKNGSTLSPSKSASYHILHINTNFVTNFSSSCNTLPVKPNNHRPTPAEQAQSDNIDKTYAAAFNGDVNPDVFTVNGNKYDQENVECESRSRRLSSDGEFGRLRRSRLRLTRVKRFQKPYAVPWLAGRHSVDTCYPAAAGGSVGEAAARNCTSEVNISEVLGCDGKLGNLAGFSGNQGSRGQGYVSGTAVAPSQDRQENTQGDKNSAHNTMTPDRPKFTHGGSGGAQGETCGGGSHHTGACGGGSHHPVPFTRSRSLDELDFSKLRVAESGNQSYIEERREIENVSTCLQNLHVNE